MCLSWLLHPDKTSEFLISNSKTRTLEFSILNSVFFFYQATTNSPVPYMIPRPRRNPERL